MACVLPLKKRGGCVRGAFVKGGFCLFPKFDNPYQSAYQAIHSTETALLSIKNEVHLSLSRGDPTALVLLDLCAAFDTTDYSTLLSCLQA